MLRCFPAHQGCTETERPGSNVCTFSSSALGVGSSSSLGKKSRKGEGDKMTEGVFKTWT